MHETKYLQNLYLFCEKKQGKRKSDGSLEVMVLADLGGDGDGGEDDEF